MKTLPVAVYNWAPMKFVTVSDVHIKKPNDSASDLFLRFLNSDEVNQSQIIFLLGDIFDLLVGPYVEYVNVFSDIFSKLDQLTSSGKKIYYFEGNHDFHFEKIISSKENWFYKNVPTIFNINNKKILLAHGDEIELNNPNYQLYRKFIRSRFIKLIASDLLNFQIVDKIGKYLSNQSREKNNKNYGQHFDNEAIKLRFRENIENAYRLYEKPDYIICGHSHCHEEWIKDRYSYYNNGYFPSSRKFHYFDGSRVVPIVLQAD